MPIRLVSDALRTKRSRLVCRSSGRWCCTVRSISSPASNRLCYAGMGLHFFRAKQGTCYHDDIKSFIFPTTWRSGLMPGEHGLHVPSPPSWNTAEISKNPSHPTVLPHLYHLQSRDGWLCGFSNRDWCPTEGSAIFSQWIWLPQTVPEWQDDHRHQN